MSEFSTSLHLWSTDVAEAVELLRAARVPGYVFPPNERWVPFVYSEGARLGSTENLERLVEVNRGLLLGYDYAGDHGCWVTVYRGSTRVARLEASFETLHASFDGADFVRLGLLSVTEAAELERWVASAHHWDARSDTSDHIVAERLGLPRYAWFSYRYADDADAPQDDRIKVDSLGSVQVPAPASGTDIEELLRMLPPTKKSPATIAAEKAAKNTKTAAKKNTKTAAKKKTAKKKPRSARSGR